MLPIAYIMMTLVFDGAKWVALFERQDETGYSVCEVFCGLSEPRLGDVYAMVLADYRTLVFSQPVDGDATEAATQRRLNFKRMQRESRRLIEHSGAVISVREATRDERALQKAQREAEAKAERTAQADYKYQRKQEQRKLKHRGR